MCYIVNVDYTQNTWMVVHVHYETHTLTQITIGDQSLLTCNIVRKCVEGKRMVASVRNYSYITQFGFTQRNCSITYPLTH